MIAESFTHCVRSYFFRQTCYFTGLFDGSISSKSIHPIVKLVMKSVPFKHLPLVKSSNIGFNFELIGNDLYLPVFFSMILMRLLLHTSPTLSATMYEILKPQFAPIVSKDKTLLLFFAKYASSLRKCSKLLIDSNDVIYSPF